MKKENDYEKSQLEKYEDIYFDDDIDIDVIQDQLSQSMQNFKINYNPTGADESSLGTEAEGAGLSLDDNIEDTENVEYTDDEASKIIFQEQRNNKKRRYSRSKKYVIYVNEENINFIDNLGYEQRESIINTILHEQDSLLKSKKQRKELQRFFVNIIVIILTLAISLPTFFVILNKSLTYTIQNYRESQENFVKLYKEMGKNKSYKQIQNKF